MARLGCRDRVATVVRVKWALEEARELAQELLLDLPAGLAHVEGVATTALALGMPRTVASAAWLHDIGYSERLHRMGMHAIDRALYLDLAATPTEVVSLVAFHTGAEYEADERGLIDKLILFDRPRQDLLDLADPRRSRDGPTGASFPYRNSSINACAASSRAAGPIG